MQWLDSITNSVHRKLSQFQEAKVEDRVAWRAIVHVIVRVEHQAEMACIFPGSRKALAAESWPFALAEFQGWICWPVLSNSEHDA